MPEISSNQPFLTLINVFTVEPENQAYLIELIMAATDDGVSRAPGFISATFHRSLDGGKVAVYSQWRSLEDYQAMRIGATSTTTLEQIAKIAQFDLGIYEVVGIRPEN